MNQAYRDALATHGASLVTHIALVDSGGAEVGDARKPVSWTVADDGLIRPDADLEFEMDEGDNVSGWKGFDAATGGTDYDGEPLTSTDFNNPGSYTLLAAQTSIQHNAG